MNKAYCSCCGRQFCESPWSKELTVPYDGAVSMGPRKYACKYCAEDLDENGLFPEERHLI